MLSAYPANRQPHSEMSKLVHFQGLAWKSFLLIACALLAFWACDEDQIEIIRTRQWSGEGVVRGTGRPKGCFGESAFFSAPLRSALKTSESLRFLELVEKSVLSILVLDHISGPMDADFYAVWVGFGTLNRESMNPTITSTGQHLVFRIIMFSYFAPPSARNLQGHFWSIFFSPFPSSTSSLKI